MPPQLGDKRLDSLVAIYLEAGRSLATLLDGLAFVDLPRQHALLQKIRGILNQLRVETNAWSGQAIREFMKETDSLAIAELSLAKENVVAAWAQINELAVSSLSASLNSKLGESLSSVNTLANRIMRGTQLGPLLDNEVRKSVAVGLAAGEGRQQLKARVAGKLKEKVSEGLVSIIGKGGRKFSFSLEYYAALTAHQTARQAATVGTINRAQQNGHDLVRVSPNPSTIGDYCDAYRGKVFSISGTSEIYPPLSRTPNSGPPFHPWCKHSLSIFIPEFHSQEEIDEWSKVDERFLLDTPEDFNGVVRDWWKAKKTEKNLGKLNQV